LVKGRPLCSAMTLTPSLLAFAVAAAGAALSIDAEQNPTGISSETSGNDTGLCNSTENAEQQQGFSPCGGAFWEVQAALGEAGAWASSTDIVDTLVDLCETEDKEACRTAVRDPSWLFACAREGLIEDAPQQSRGSDTRMRLAFLLLRHAADLAVRKTWEEKHFLEDPVPCRQPAFKSDAHRKFDAELQEVPVVPGRQCTDGACARDRCGLVVLDNVLLPEEVEALKSHAGAAGAERAEAGESGERRKARYGTARLCSVWGPRRSRALHLHPGEIAQAHCTSSTRARVLDPFCIKLLEPHAYYS